MLKEELPTILYIMGWSHIEECCDPWKTKSHPFLLPAVHPICQPCTEAAPVLGCAGPLTWTPQDSWHPRMRDTPRGLPLMDCEPLLAKLINQGTFLWAVTCCTLPHPAAEMLRICSHLYLQVNEDSFTDTCRKIALAKGLQLTPLPVFFFFGMCVFYWSNFG